MTDPDHRRRRRHSSDGPGWRSDRARPLILLASIFAIILVAAGVAFVLGGGPSGPGGTTAPPTAGPSLPVSLAPGTGSPVPSGTASGAPLQSASPGPSAPSTAGGEPGIQTNRIKIDRLGIDLAIIQGDGIDAPIGKAAHYPSSAWPGGGSNIYIYGHADDG